VENGSVTIKTEGLKSKTWRTLYWGSLFNSL